MRLESSSYDYCRFYVFHLPTYLIFASHIMYTAGVLSIKIGSRREKKKK